MKNISVLLKQIYEKTCLFGTYIGKKQLYKHI